MYDPAIGRFTSVDALADHPNQVGFTPYHYTYNNPILYTDPDGNCPDCVWDAINVGIGVRSFIKNVRKGNVGGAIVDGLGIIVDGAAAIVPFVPGGAGTLIKAGRGAGNAVDLARTSENVTDASKAGNNVDYIGFPDGTTVHKSQSKMEQSLENAGFQGENLYRSDGSVKGREYSLENVNARAMEPDGTNPRRTSFENKSGQPSQPSGEQVKTHEVKGLTKPERKEYVRQRTHAIQNN